MMLAALAPLTGCGFFRHVSVEPVATASHRPSNVAAYVAVSDGEQPLVDLEPSNFHVYENGQLVPPEQTQLTLLDRNLSAAHHALLLVDLSGAKAPETRELVAKGALGFVQLLSGLEGVSVYAFDGGEGLVQLATVARGGPAPSLAALESFTPRDPSRNLNGAVLAALDKLDDALAQSGKVVRVGTLVVLSYGPDMAGRVDSDALHDAIRQSPHDVIAVGIGERAGELESIARGGLVRAQAAGTVHIALEEAAQKARDQVEKHYLVSYCSPARAGSRRLRLEVRYTDKEGSERSGDFETDFDAKGFGPGCDSRSTPRFTAKPKPAPKPAPGAGQGATEPSKPKKPAPDSREHDRGEDAPVPPPERSGYAE